MSRTKKQYTNGQQRGGTSPEATYTGFGGMQNLHKSPRKYEKRPVTLPPMGLYLQQRKTA